MPEEDIIKSALQKAMNEENDEGKKKTLKRQLMIWMKKIITHGRGKLKVF